MSEQRRDRFETHPTIDRLGRERVSELVRLHVTDTRMFGDGVDVTVDSAPVEGMTVVAFNKPTRP